MPAIAPLAAAAATKARKEGATLGFDQGRQGLVNTAVYANATVRSALEKRSNFFYNLDTAGGDQQLPTKPVVGPTIPAPVAAGSQ